MEDFEQIVNDGLYNTFVQGMKVGAMTIAIEVMARINDMKFSGKNIQKVNELKEFLGTLIEKNKKEDIINE